ncbi:MAG: ABC transporter permease [Vicinamibacterales bacterium]
MGLWQDLRFATRLLVKDKWFAAAAVVALALGIGVNATVFTFVNAVLIRGLPFDDPDRIMAIGSYDRVRSRDLGVSYEDFADWRQSATRFAGLAAYSDTTMNVSDEGRPPERDFGTFLSANAFALLGQAPMLGRDFLPDDDRPGAPGVVILGSAVWKSRYGADPGILGRVVRVNDVPSVVIGVMPEDFRFPQNSDLWQPLGMVADLPARPRNARTLGVFGRLRPEASRAEADAELQSIGQRLSRDHPSTNTDVVPRLQTFNERVNGGPIRAVFLSLMGAVAFVLLIACANVANLLLSRAAHRTREIAVRISIGANRWRVVRQLLVESLLLAVVAGLLGLGLAAVGIRLFDLATQDVGRPYWIAFTMDGRVIAFLAAICVGTAILFGLAPALHVSRTDVNDVLKDGGRSGTAGVRVGRWSSVLVMGELALTLTLLAGAGFMMRNFLTLYRLDLGVDTSRLVAMSLTLPDRKYPAVEERLAFYDRLRERLAAVGSVRAASVASNLPLGGGFARRLSIDGRTLAKDEQAPTVTMLTVDPRYFETLGLAVTRGRALDGADGLPGRDGVVVNDRFARRYFPDEDPLGRRIELTLDTAGGAPPPGVAASIGGTIVGIVPNVWQRDLSAPESDPIAYVPFRADPRAFMQLLVRADGDPQAVVPLVREEVRAIDPDLPLYNVRTLDEALARQRWAFRVFGTMFAIFAGIALALSAVGLYAVTAYSVSQRTQEIGVRMALGAAGGDVAGMFLRRSLWQLAVGLSVGLAGALAVGQLFQRTELLVQTTGRDPATIGLIALVLVAVSLAASVWPARRASRLDPLAALRND